MASGRKGKNAREVYSGSFEGLCNEFLQSEKFKGYSQSTQTLWRREIAYACAPNCLGHVSLTDIRPALVQGYLDGWADKPGKQNAALDALQAVEKWAIKRDLLSREITKGIETVGSKGGHIPWTDSQVDHAARHARCDLAHVIALGAASGQRLSDLIRMGWGDIESYRGQRGINVTQQKTGRQVWCPILEDLEAHLATWARRPGPILRRRDGRPWERSALLTLAWRHELARNPQLAEHREKGLVLHGLRGHCCVRLSRAGLTDHQISDIVGMSIPMVGRYTRLSAQRENALAAVLQLYPRKPLKEHGAQ